MISTSDLIHLPYTRDLSEAGIAYALRSLSYKYDHVEGAAYEYLRQIVAGVAVELAFRRHLSEQNIPFDVKGAMPFTDPDHYDVSLGGRRCKIQSFLISHREQILEMRRTPQIVLNAPALVPSDQNAAEGNSDSDLYLFAFLSGLVAASQADLQKAMDANQSHHMIHVMPASWSRPAQWNPLGALVLKSDSEQSQSVEIGGQDAGREMRSRRVEMPPHTRIQIDDGFFSLAYIHSKSIPKARIGIHSPSRRETYIINPLDWGNIWVYGLDILLAGFLTRGEFNERASFLHEGARVFQYDRMPTKSLSVSVSELKPLSELFERVKAWAPPGSNRDASQGKAAGA
jgi:hypothetical protein